MNQSLSLLARILMAAIFVISGVSKVTGFREAVHMSAAAGVPAPALAIACALVIEIGCGIALLAGWHTGKACLILFLYLIPVTLVFHARLASPIQSRVQLTEVLKNLAIMGGLLRFYIGSSGARALSIPGLGRRAA